jgi:hypothetical protein
MFDNLLIAMLITLVSLTLILNFGRLYDLAEQGLALFSRLIRKIRLFIDVAARAYRRCHRMPYYS